MLKECTAILSDMRNVLNFSWFLIILLFIVVNHKVDYCRLMMMKKKTCKCHEIKIIVWMRIIVCYCRFSSSYSHQLASFTTHTNLVIDLPLSFSIVSIVIVNWETISTKIEFS